MAVIYTLWKIFGLPCRCPSFNQTSFAFAVLGIFETWNSSHWWASTVSCYNCFMNSYSNVGTAEYHNKKFGADHITLNIKIPNKRNVSELQMMSPCVVWMFSNLSCLVCSVCLVNIYLRREENALVSSPKSHLLLGK